jgi:hypothetical protein
MAQLFCADYKKAPDAECGGAFIFAETVAQPLPLSECCL